MWKQSNCSRCQKPDRPTFQCSSLAHALLRPTKRPQILPLPQLPASIGPLQARYDAKDSGGDGKDVCWGEVSRIPQRIKEGKRHDGSIEGKQGPDDGDVLLMGTEGVGKLGEGRARWVARIGGVEGGEGCALRCWRAQRVRHGYRDIDGHNTGVDAMIE